MYSLKSIAIRKQFFLQSYIWIEMIYAIVLMKFNFSMIIASMSTRYEGC